MNFIPANFILHKTSTEGNIYGYARIQILGIGLKERDGRTEIASYLCRDASVINLNTGHVWVCEGEELLVLAECYQKSSQFLHG